MHFFYSYGISQLMQDYNGMVFITHGTMPHPLEHYPGVLSQRDYYLTHWLHQAKTALKSE
jgi:hypothetical protein